MKHTTIKGILRKCSRAISASLIGAALIAGAPLPAAAETVIKAVMDAPLRILDPITTSAFITRNHGYMIYDTLVAMDEHFQVQPQMADWKVSADGLVYTFTLRDGLQWHDGQPVTAEDCVASLNRWAQRDAGGQMLFAATKELKATGPNTFTLTLNEPVTFVLSVLGKTATNVPFMMPKRVASTPATEPITDYTGSGPFKFSKDEFKPGVKAVYLKNEKYVSRKEPSSWAAGAKPVKVDRVEWLVMPDAQTAVTALESGEIDYLMDPQFDLLKLLEGDKDIVIGFPNEFGYQLNVRMNFKTPPFNDVKARRAVLLALKQESFLAAIAGNPKFYKVCGAMFTCGTPYATDIGSEPFVKGNGMAEAKKMLKESSYNGAPIRIVQPTDTNSLKTQPVVAAQLLREAGFNVELVPLDWAAALALRNNPKPASEGGWNLFFSAMGGADAMNPIINPYMAASPKTPSVGWPDMPEIEALRIKFARAKTEDERKSIAQDLQRVALEQVLYVPLGQLGTSAAWSVKLKNVAKGPIAPYFWNMEKAK
jgi:peptide/nickel transport system substrate-binding protein